MSKPQQPAQAPPNYSDYKSDDPLHGLLDGITRLLLWLGLGGTVIGLSFLVYTYVTFSGSSLMNPAQATANVATFSKILMGGLIALAVSTTLIWWGEETLAVLQLGFAAVLFFAPMFLPGMFGGADNAATRASMEAIQTGGQILGAIAILVLIADISSRVRLRARDGSRADQLKYGKGVKEERDIQNIFMGKCWQLPFCRKFVRERCPIYHSRRTCWRERTGCMCEEEVIRSAMENRPIPKDQILAAQFIPRNNRLSEGQKAERCRQCVIYNEHQKHKYRLLLPLTIIVFVGFYVMFRTPMLEGTSMLVQRIDKIMAGATYRAGPTTTATSTTGMFQEVLLGAFVVVAFAYALKMLEFLIFRLKI